jgi:hypothetical protein
MNLPFFKKKAHEISASREYFFALEINPSSVKSAVWSVINDKTQVLSVGTPADWDGQSEESLLSAVDQSLSDSTTRLDPKGSISPEKVIFGLPSDWLHEEKILPENLRLLKYISQKLSLSAVGFVITSDATVRFLEHQEGVPPTAILVGICPSQIELTLVRLGKVDGVQIVRRSQKIVADVVEGLTRFPRVDMYPSRIMLYDSLLNLEEIKQQLLAHPWQAPQTHLTFLHFPKIETLPVDFTIRAIATAGGTEVARSIGLITDKEPEPALETSSKPNSPGDFGFSETDVANIDVPQFAEKPQLETEPELKPEPESETPAEFIPFPHSKKKLSLPKFKFSFVFIVLGVLCGLGALFAAYWYLPKATVTLTLVPKSLSSQFELIVDTTAQTVNSDSRTIPGTYKEVTSTEEKSSATTGTKLVGDKATGAVTIINGTSIPRTFPAGTTISSPSGLSFVTASEVQVASASGTADPNSYQPGKANVNVTASQIGSDSNITAGTQFRVGTYSSLDFVAKNDSAFAGGTSRQVKVVAKDDIQNLRTQLLAALKETSKNQLISEISQDQQLLAETVTTQAASEDLNHQVDEQADSVTLRLTVKAKGLTYQKADLTSIIQNETRSQVPDGFVSIGELEPTFAVKKTDKNSVILAVNVSGSLLPRIAEKEVVSRLVGVSPQAARNYLSGLSGVSHIEMAFSLPLPDFLLTLPHTSSNISLEVKSQ